MYNIVLTNYGNTQISNKVILDGVILLSDYISNISTVASVTGYSVKLDIPARGNVKDKIGNILIRDDSTNTYTAKTILFYKNVNSEKKIIAGFSQNSAIINKLNKAINLFLSFDFSVFTNGFQFALVQAGFSQASQNVDGLVHIEDPNVEFDDSYSVYSKVQIDNKLSSYAQTSDIPTKVSQLDNDSNFINQHQSIKTINSQSLVGTGNITISQGEYNKINTISVNSANQTPDSNKNVNITVPTKVSQLDNDLGFITSGVVPTNYVTVNTTQDITAAKTFKNATDTTKIDGKEIVISGTDTYNVSGAGAGTNYPNSPSSVTATTETKIDHNTISCNGNSIGYYRNYYPTPNQSSDPAYVSYNDGIEIKTKSCDTIWCTGDISHSWFRLALSNSDNDSYFSGLELIECSTVNDDQAITEDTIFSVNANESIFNSAVTFSRYVTVDGDYLRIQDHGEYTRISEYVKQSSLYYNRANSVITATSDTVIEPSSNDTISLGTSTNKFSNIYATTFNGDLSGNASSATTAVNADHAISADSATHADSADSATKATQDENGNTISSYYCTLSTEQIISGIKQFNGNLYALGYNDSDGIRFGDNATSAAYPRIVGETVSTTECALRQHYYVDNTLKNSIQTICDSNGNLTTITKLGRHGNDTTSTWTVGSESSKLKQTYVDNIGSTSAPVKTMYISGGNSNNCYITIDNSGGEPTMAPNKSNYCYLGTESKHWFKSYINTLYVGSSAVNLPPITAAGITTIGSIQFLRVTIPANTTTGLINAGKSLSASSYTLAVVTATPGYTYLGFRYSQAPSGTWVTLTDMYYYNDGTSASNTYVLAYKQA